ncbi:hypothetical protein JQX13_31515 [Archangium violaceum]|uniref:aconitase family protein n=1 Tax=Archangium violaceum TaxID=83451 RepID=UPI00193BEB7A|nr:aconitase family protein [Archangium violaceum]QRK04742.1 hypothetical protein JQX13_31515 [Archangium violaceum]
MLATQTLVQKHPKNMKVDVRGRLPPGATAKDLALHVMRCLGTAGGTGHVIEYTGPAIEALDMAGRMDNVVQLKASEAGQLVTWGTTPATAIRLDDALPDPAAIEDPTRRKQTEQMLRYMGLSPGQKLRGVPVDVVFIGSCTNARIENLRAAAEIVKGRHVAAGVRALVVPGSGQTKAMAEAEGLAELFTAAGWEWRESGCSLCLGMNAPFHDPDGHRGRPALAGYRHGRSIVPPSW